MSKVVRVAVIGYGGMGGWHTKRLQEIPGVVELAGVYDILPERNAAAWKQTASRHIPRSRRCSQTTRSTP